MNLLIVDDEPLEVTIIERMINKKQMDIEDIYTAYSMKQAIEVLKAHDISILLTDIQMPKGSGHDLVRWTLEQDMNLTTIFLTSHDDFGYAREAIRLNVCEYLLKPITKEELERALSMAVSRIHQRYQEDLNQRMASFWKSGRVMLKQEFWRKVLFEEGDASFDLLLQRYRKSGIPVSRQDIVYPILLTWRRKDERADVWKDSSIEFVLQNIATEVLWGNTNIGNIIVNPGFMVILYDIEEKEEAFVLSKCEIMQQQYSAYLEFCDIHIYVNGKARISELRQKVTKLMQYEEGDVQKRYRVLNLKEVKNIAIPYEKPDLKSWIEGIFSPYYDKTIKEMQWYLKKLKESNGNAHGILNRFQQDFLQELYILLEQKGIQANAIFQDEEMVDRFNKAVQSVSLMEEWLISLIDYLVSYNHQIEEAPNIVTKIRDYIKTNLEGELSRNTLAQIVFLHPDYMSHIFKDQMGISISDYIIKERIKKARILLTSTGFSISEIATKTGYPNTAYFTKLFKRVTGLTPKEYRNSMIMDSVYTG